MNRDVFTYVVIAGRLIVNRFLYESRCGGVARYFTPMCELHVIHERLLYVLENEIIFYQSREITKSNKKFES